MSSAAPAWGADHIYKHQPNAIEAFALVAFLAYTIFHACLTLNVRPEIRRGKTELFGARLIAAELYLDAGDYPTGRSP